MHADQDCFLRVLAKDEVDRRLHSPDNIVGTFTTLYSERCMAALPLIQHVMVILILFDGHALAFADSPADLIETGQRLVRYAEPYKLAHRLLAAFQGRSVNFVEWNVTVSLEKSERLSATEIVKVGVNAASLNDVSQVKISLTVPYQVNFFDVQFSAILRPLLSKMVRRGRTHRLLEKQAQK